MFKAVGSGLQDVVVAEVVLRKALHAGLATPLPIRSTPSDGSSEMPDYTRDEARGRAST
jgi:hypothetical protein